MVHNPQGFDFSKLSFAYRDPSIYEMLEALLDPGRTYVKDASIELTEVPPDATKSQLTRLRSSAKASLLRVPNAQAWHVDVFEKIDHPKDKQDILAGFLTSRMLRMFQPGEDENVPDAVAYARVYKHWHAHSFEASDPFNAFDQIPVLDTQAIAAQ